MCDLKLSFNFLPLVRNVTLSCLLNDISLQRIESHVVLGPIISPLDTG